MPFKKLSEALKESIDHLGYEDPLPFQKNILSKIKGGANVFGIGPKGCGKTTAMIISTIQRLNSAAFEDAPRALIFVKDKQTALDLEQDFRRYTRNTDLRVYCAYDQLDIEIQKGDIYEGVDIVIGTPRRLKKLFHLNALNLGKLQLFIVEDAEFLVQRNDFIDLVRIPESLNRCQYLIFATVFDKRLERIRELFMQNAQLVKVES